MWLAAVSAVWLTLAMAMLLKWLVGRIFPTTGIGGGKVVKSQVTGVDLVTKAGSHEDSNTAGSTKPLHKYDVFINHRGPDVKRTFAAHLCDALSRAGFFPFLDAKSIKQGRSVFKSIDEALSDACVHVAIFSKCYAESKYCLDELLDMLQSGKVILPVFYDVKPQHLRRTEEGPFTEGFGKHAKRKRHDKIPKWREALRKASEIMGYENNGDESELVRSIVVAVGNSMPVNLPPSKRRFGVEVSVKDVLSRSDTMRAGVNVLGLVGAGGIGKTTLASEIYNHFVSRRQFQYHCFLKDVRSSDTFELRQQLLRELIQVDLPSKSSEEYHRKLGVLNSQRVFLIVDDIDDAIQFADLIPDINQLGSGSRIVITSRDRAVLDFTMREASSKVIYEVQLLNRTDSQLLFNWNAFYNEVPSPGFGDLAEKVVEACGGHPLALEVIGASLFGKGDREIWMDAVKTLGEDKTIHKKLRISYDSLPSPGDQAMFRDIACLLIGMPVDVAMTIWRSCQSCSDFCCTPKAPHLVLRRLLDRSLVKLDSGRLSMHDVIRDMGREIVRQESPKVEERTHLWDTTTAAKVLSRNKGSDRIRGVRLCTRDTDGTLTSKASQLATMDELHLLVLDGYPIEPDDFSRWSQELRWLQWKSLPYMELPSQFNLSKLAVLDLTDSVNLSHLWKNGARIQFPCLQVLVLTNCRALEELPRNLGQSVPRLKTMEMEKCSLMALLPDSLGELTHLEHLILSDCESLEALPDTLVNLVKLQNLVLDGCVRLSQLPTSMAGLRMLKKLRMTKCPVKDLPEDFGQLTSLDFLSIDMLCSVPRSFRRLESLAFLLVDRASDLGGWLASSLEALTALKTLHLCNNPTIITLPEGLGNMKTLRHLQVVNSSALVTIEVLPQSLQCLDLGNCRQLVNIPSLRELSSLTLLNLCNCRKLRQIHGLEYLTALEDINLSGATSLSDCLPVLQSGSYRGLRNCGLSGSKVAMAYDNRWKEEKPALQLITYYDDSIGYFPNGMAREFSDQARSFHFLIEATILTQAKCLALIFCFVAHDQGRFAYPEDHGYYNSVCGMTVQIMREGKVVTETGLLPLRHADKQNQVYLWTLRGEHPVVQLLQLGDRICIYARSEYPRWAVTVREGAICVVHAEDDHLSLAINSKQLNSSDSESFSSKLGGLVFTDDFHLTLKPELEVGSTFDDLLASDNDSLSQHAANSDVTFDKPPQQGWLIAPAYGHYDWNLSWKLPREGRGCVSFEAQARNNIHVAISEHRSDSERPFMYEIIIGGWGNTTSVIQKHLDREEKVLICCSVAAGLTHPEGINRLWVSIDERISMIQVGRGEPALQDVIAVFRDGQFLSKVQIVSFTSMDNPVTYSNAVITDAKHLPPLLHTYRLSEKMLQSVVNGEWAMTAKLYGHYTWAQHWMLPRAGRGILSFRAKREFFSDIYVAISSHPYTMDPMYEIFVRGFTYTPTSVLRKQSQGPAVCEVEHDELEPFDVEHDRDIVHRGINQFWVLIDDRTGTIQVGKGEPLHNMFLIYKDAAFLSEARYCTFTNSATPVTYSSVEITAVLD